MDAFLKNPFNPAKNMDKTTQLAGLGALAAGEFLERRNEQNDEYRASQIQAAQGYGNQPRAGLPQQGYS